jgi:flavin reductase (DIM6/NTAB) family NADH-FMN oxidoreductase RutF
MAISQATFRAAMGQLASGVTVITFHTHGQDHGFTATSFTSLSLEPMLVLVCVVKEQRSHALLQHAGHYAVNVLASSQKELGMRFANALPSERFAGLEVARAQTGAPILPDSLAWVDCTIREVVAGGDHSIFIGEVVAGAASSTDEALVYQQRRWGRFVSDP